MKRARSEEAKEERREKFLNAALDEFYKKGFAAASMDDIAERASLSKGTLYLYFTSKQDLFSALIKKLTQPNLDTINMLATTSPSIEMALQGIAKFVPTVIRQKNLPRLMKVLIGESQTFPEIISSYKKNTVDKILALITEMLKEANERGEIAVSQPALTAKLIMSPIVFSGVWEATFAKHDKSPLDLDEFFQTHVDYIYKAIKIGDIQ